MDIQQAKDIVKNTFEKPFDKNQYIYFCKNLLNSYDESKAFNQPLTGQYIKESYRGFISKFDRIGRYSHNDNEIIDILIVYLQKDTSIERARTAQRNFIAGYLKGDYGSTSLKDAALVAFVSPNSEDWRFSLVKMDYKFNEKGRVKEEFTPARRWSFLVGLNENSHTAQSRLVPIISNDEQSPVLAEIEEAFNIEKVTKEFFEKYRELFIRTKDELDKVIKKDIKVQIDFDKKGINTVDFAKKLLGQIVFLYFLQKKGWFGVHRDAEWGTGSKNFLRELFNKEHGNNNFFNDMLEPLFYDALSRDRSDIDHWNDQFKCKIPFLNGGLFDPMNNYDWVKTELFLPNELFSNTQKTQMGEIGTGIFDEFDRYNFTVKEDEPLEKEVAIDPELLGKAYEKFNAIRPDNYLDYIKALKSGNKGEESKFNKQYGVYYTPREIVHYMCQQSLINYLNIEMNDCVVSYEKLGEDQIDIFGNQVKNGQLDLTIEHKSKPTISKEDIELLVCHGEYVSENEMHIENSGRETSTYRYKLPESIRNSAEAIDQKVANIKVCDPAIGSGAFPVGMMNEIVKVRNVLTHYIKKNDRSLYHFKRECIENSLYGVDIDPGAVEIAKLRLWLSLIVDEDDISQIKPLPNLDYKIVCGNSLLNFPDTWDSPIAKEIESLKHEYFNETNPKKKNEFKSTIDEKINYRYTNSLKNFGYEVNFDFKTVFSEVFHEKSGFNVVIANPPYVSGGKIKNIKPSLKQAYGDFYSGSADLYTFFFKKGVDLLCSSGCICFITSNKFMRAGYGQKTRELLTNKITPIRIIDFGELPVFEAATDPSIIIASKSSNTACELEAITIKSEEEIYNLNDVVKERCFIMPVSSLSAHAWILEDHNILKLKEKLKTKGIPLGNFIDGKIYYGIKTGFNQAFIIDEGTKKALISEDRKSKELIKPWLDGNEMKRWFADWGGSYVIFTRHGVDINQYKAIKKYLSQFRKDLEPKTHEGQKYGRKPGPYKWYEVQDNVAYYKNFEKTKIVYNETSKELHAFIDNEGYYINKTGFIILSDENEYLLGILNSKLMDWYYRVDFPTYGDPWKGGRIQFRKEPNMIAVPIVSASIKQKNLIIERVKKILADPNNSKVSKIEKEIDNIVYELYDLSKDDIKLIEGL